MVEEKFAACQHHSRRTKENSPLGCGAAGVSGQVCRGPWGILCRPKAQVSQCRVWRSVGSQGAQRIRGTPAGVPGLGAKRASFAGTQGNSVHDLGCSISEAVWDRGWARGFLDGHPRGGGESLCEQALNGGGGAESCDSCQVIDLGSASVYATTHQIKSWRRGRGHKWERKLHPTGNYPGESTPGKAVEDKVPPPRSLASRPLESGKPKLPPSVFLQRPLLTKPVITQNAKETHLKGPRPFSQNQQL